MKKVLFATTALVMSMTWRRAVMEIHDRRRRPPWILGPWPAQRQLATCRARVKFTLTGESDAGLSFGASFRADNADDDAKNGTSGSVWISGTYGKLEMGDTVSATEAAIGDLYEVGYTQGGFGYDIEEISYLTGDNTDQGPNILYSYTMDRFSVYASASDGQDTAWPTTVGADEDDDLDAHVLLPYRQLRAP